MKTEPLESKTHVVEEALGKMLAEALTTAGVTVGTAESCTGGAIAFCLTKTPGSSAYFNGGVVAYSNKLKTALLGVPVEMLEQVGAVSEEVAACMAEGARERLMCDIAVATTGIAGPGGGSKTKPVGLVYIAAAVEGHTLVRRFVFRGERQAVREQAAQEALALVLEIVQSRKTAQVN